jgi:hypothetical protein
VLSQIKPQAPIFFVDTHHDMSSSGAGLKLQDITREEACATLAAVPWTSNAKGCRLALKGTRCLTVTSWEVPEHPIFDTAKKKKPKAPSHSNGYIKLKVRGRGARQEFYLQQLAAIAQGFTGLADVGGHASTHECSHLCHEVACFNLNHIVVEPTLVNKSRNKCVKLMCACGHEVTNCTHQPACIL